MGRFVSPEYPGYFSTVDHLEWYKPASDKPFIGILSLVMPGLPEILCVENAVIKELERQGLNVLPAFSYSTRNGERIVAEVLPLLKITSLTPMAARESMH